MIPQTSSTPPQTTTLNVLGKEPCNGINPTCPAVRHAMCFAAIDNSGIIIESQDCNPIIFFAEGTGSDGSAMRIKPFEAYRHTVKYRLASLTPVDPASTADTSEGASGGTNN